jgi:predicted metal-binding protein
MLLVQPAGEFDVDAFEDKEGNNSAGYEAFTAFKEKLLLISSNCMQFNEGNAEYCQKAEAFRQGVEALCEEKWMEVTKAVFDSSLRP